MPEYLSLKRSIEHVRQLPDGVEILCDCGTPTELVFEVEPGAVGTVEHAFTCDGCLTVHWYIVTVQSERADA